MVVNQTILDRKIIKNSMIMLATSMVACEIVKQYVIMIKRMDAIDCSGVWFHIKNARGLTRPSNHHHFDSYFRGTKYVIPLTIKDM